MIGEQFKCLSCYQVGALDAHGACSSCRSQKVVSCELLAVLCDHELVARISEGPAKGSMSLLARGTKIA
jgi:hypothetical protein